MPNIRQPPPMLLNPIQMAREYHIATTQIGNPVYYTRPIGQQGTIIDNDTKQLIEININKTNGPNINMTTSPAVPLIIPAEQTGQHRNQVHVPLMISRERTELVEQERGYRTHDTIIPGAQQVALQPIVPRETPQVPQRNIIPAILRLTPQIVPIVPRETPVAHTLIQTIPIPGRPNGRVTMPLRGPIVDIIEEDGGVNVPLQVSVVGAIEDEDIDFQNHRRLSPIEVAELNQHNRDFAPTIVRKTKLTPIMVPPLVQPVKKPVDIFTAPQLPAQNPYLTLPGTILNTIAQERDINVTGTNEERATQLYEYDHIMPDWIQSILNKDIQSFLVLSGTKLYVFGALNGVNFNEPAITALNNRDLIKYIRLEILRSNPNHPGRFMFSDLLQGVQRSVLEILAHNYIKTYIKFVNTEDLKKAILHGKSDHIDFTTIIAIGERYDLLVNHRYSRLLSDLYEIDTEDNSWVRVARQPPHPMETIILGLDKYRTSDIIDTLGMAIPLMHAANVDGYVAANIVSYAKILTRGALNSIPLEVLFYLERENILRYVSQLKDSEIFSNIGIYVPYTSRSELVTNTVDAITQTGFMYPAHRSEAYSINKETPVVGTPITDVNTFMVCYGTSIRYMIYELEELIGAFYRDDATLIMEFRHPDNTKLKFSLEEIEGLRRLLTCFAPDKDIIMLMNRIDEGIFDQRERIEFDETAQRNLAGLAQSTREEISEFLRQIFHVGMYMRRWKGPGHPFPLKAEETKTDALPDVEVTRELLRAIDMLEHIGKGGKAFCLSLEICEYNRDGGIDHGRINFRDQWEAVINGTQCIRMASTKFIGTGYHYLRILFHETIPGMDVKALVRVV